MNKNKYKNKIIITIIKRHQQINRYIAFILEVIVTSFSEIPFPDHVSGTTDLNISFVGKTRRII